MDFDLTADQRVKSKEREKKDKYLDLAREQQKILNIRVTVILIVIGELGTTRKRIGKEIGRFGNKRTSGDHPDSNIFQIGHNTVT